MKHGPFPSPRLCCPAGSSGTAGRSATLPAGRDFAGSPLIRAHRFPGEGPQTRGRGGLPQFPQRPSSRSAPSTPGGSSPLRFQALRGFRGLRPEFPGSAPPCPLKGLASRGGRIHLTLRTGRLLPPKGHSTLGFDAGRFPPAPPACYPAPWCLPGPDFHRLAVAGLCSDQVIFDRPPPNSGHTNVRASIPQRHVFRCCPRW